MSSLKCFPLDATLAKFSNWNNNNKLFLNCKQDKRAQLYLSNLFFYLTLFFVYPLTFVSISCLSTSIYLYLFVNPVGCLPHFIYLSIQIHSYIFQLRFFISLYSLYTRLYLFLSLVYPSLFPHTSLSIWIDAYLFLSFCQSKFMAISFKAVFYLTLFFLYLYVFVSISCLSTYISLYFYINADWCLSLSICLSIQIHGYIFQTCFLYLILFFVYPPIFVSISCLSTYISLYLLVNPDWNPSLYIFLSI